MRHKGSVDEIHAKGMEMCPFLYKSYTDIYNKVRKDEIDLNLLNRFLNVLQQIENGEVDQHEGSFIVGTILKEIYIDSALRKSDKLDADREADPDGATPLPLEPVNDVSWATFKKQS